MLRGFISSFHPAKHLIRKVDLCTATTEPITPNQQDKKKTDSNKTVGLRKFLKNSQPKIEQDRNTTDGLGEFIKDSQSKFEEVLGEIEKLSQMRKTSTISINKLFRDQSNKTTASMVRLERLIAGQVESNRVATKLLSEVKSKLVEANDELKAKTLSEAINQTESMKFVWKEIFKDLTKGYNDIIAQKANAKAQNEVNIVIKTIANKGETAARELKFLMEKQMKDWENSKI